MQRYLILTIFFYHLWQQGNLKNPECPSEEFDKRVLTEAGLTPASCNPDTMLTAMSPASNLAVSFHQGSNGAGLEVKCEFIPVAKSNTVSEERAGEDKGEDLHRCMNL